MEAQPHGMDACSSGDTRMTSVTQTAERWFAINKAHPVGRLLADRHYSRQKVGSKQFCRPGENIVLATNDGRAVWVSWRPKPGINRMDGLDAIECTLFRNEGPYLSSDLASEAVALTVERWGWPRDGFITYIDAAAIASPNPGYCFKQAGWQLDKTYRGKKGLLRLRLGRVA